MRTLVLSTLLLVGPAAAIADEPSGGAPVYDVTELTLSGGVERELVVRVLDETATAMASCHGKAQGVPTGTLTLKIRIDGKGAVVSASATGVASLNACVGAAFKALAFPAPARGKVEVTEKLALRARTAGVLGAAGSQGGAFASSAGTGDVGGDEANIYGGLPGNESSEMNGGFGYGRSGFGPAGSGGGGTGWGTIGRGTGRGGMRGKTSGIPSVSMGQPAANGELDKAIIRRYIRRNLQRIQYCYEKELLAAPKLAGTVTVKFRIEANGTVGSATATGLAKVDECIAKVVENIEFPKPKDGGVVEVSYPFVFKLQAE